MSFEEQVRERAYHIWLAGGQADGYAHEHWVCAEQALRGERAVDAEPVVILTKTAGKPRKAAAKVAVVKAKVTKTAAPKTAAKPVVKAKAAKSGPKSGMVQPTAH